MVAALGRRPRGAQPSGDRVGRGWRSRFHNGEVLDVAAVKASFDRVLDPAFKARAFYQDIKRRLPAHGRQAGDVKILPGVQVFVGRTEAAAREKFDYLQSLIDPVVGAYVLCNLLGDFSQVDPDGPIPDDIALTLRTSNADKAIALARAEKLTVRQLYQRLAGKAGIRQIIGSAEQVVQDLQTWFDADACDGFNICPAYSPGNVRDFVDLVVPELQAGGLFRADYEPTSLRQNLGLPPV